MFGVRGGWRREEKKGGIIGERETRRLRSDATDSIPVDYCYTSPRTFLVVEPWDLRCRKDESQEVSDG